MEIKKAPSLVQTIVVVCEGASENTYLQELNRFFREHRIPLNFIPRVVGNGSCKAVMGYYRNIRRFMKNEEIIIWVDLDIYMSSEAHNYARKPSDIPDFLFSEMNFEDFLVLHMNPQRVFEWQGIAEKHEHFQQPLPASVYGPIYKAICFNRYRKGRMPFRLNAKSLGQMFANLKNKHIRFGNGFGVFLENLLKEMGWWGDEQETPAPDIDTV